MYIIEVDTRTAPDALLEALAAHGRPYAAEVAKQVLQGRQAREDSERKSGKDQP